MPEFDSGTKTKIAAIRTALSNGTMPEVYELVKVEWPSPTGDIYYASTQVDEVASSAPSVSPIHARLVPASIPELFAEVELTAGISDEEIELRLWDADSAITTLLNTHGEGVRVELLYWFPQQTLLLPIWFGHLRLEDEAEVDIITLKAVQGFRSADAVVPSRAHYRECQAVFGGLFDTQAEIDEGDCPYNRQIVGGTTGELDTGSVPFTNCPRRTDTDCTTRLGDALHHLSHRTIQVSAVNNQTSGPTLFSKSIGNETALKEPVRVVMGARRIRGMSVMAYHRALNNNNPEHGWFLAQYEACEGPVESITNAVITVGGVSQNAQAMHYGYRLGTKGQTAVMPTLTTHPYSSTALILYNFGWVNPAGIEPGDASASAVVHGLNNIRVYTDDTTYTEEWTNNRVWQLMRILCDKRWGYGLDYARINKASFIAAAAWAEQYVRFTDTFGTNWDHIRSMSDVDLSGRKVQEQINDLCLAGRLSPPFIFNGEIHIVPLEALDGTALSAAPEFTDTGDDRNIVWENDRTTLTISRKSDLDLPNRIECTFDDVTNHHLETPLAPVEDIDAQLRAGRVVGDNSRKVNVKKYSLLGVVTEAAAIKTAWALLDLGEFDSGGLKNNCRVKFKVWFTDALDLHPYKVIKVTAARVQAYNFTYFRIMTMERHNDLTVTIEAQAYNDTYMDAFETDIMTTPPTPTPPGPTPIPPPCVLTFGDVVYTTGAMSIPIPPC